MKTAIKVILAGVCAVAGALIAKSYQIELSTDGTSNAAANPNYVPRPRPVVD